MEIKNVRVDSRGIHGQVAVSWVPNLKINRIMVIDDKIVKDAMQKSILKMACPANIKLSIISTDRAKLRLSDPANYENENILILLPNVSSLKTLSDKGIDFKEVNLGNVSNRPNTSQLAKTVYLTDEELAQVKDLSAKGTRFYHQMVYSDSQEEINL